MRFIPAARDSHKTRNGRERGSHQTGPLKRQEQMRTSHQAKRQELKSRHGNRGLDEIGRYMHNLSLDPGAASAGAPGPKHEEKGEDMDIGR